MPVVVDYRHAPNCDPYLKHNAAAGFVPFTGIRDRFADVAGAVDSRTEHSVTRLAKSITFNAVGAAARRAVVHDQSVTIIQ
jgi:hypothetical protein